VNAQPLFRYPFRLAASFSGYAITAFVIWWQLSRLGGLAPDLAIWDRVGDQVAQGVSPYGIDLPWQGLFFYAPPWALGFALTSWLPIQIQAGLLFALEMVALRYVAGSWLRVGYLGLCPLTGAELANGSFNLVMAAAIASAVRGDGRAAAFMALAKFSPILAVRDWRRAAVVLLAAGIVTLPVAFWWRDWIQLLLYTNAHYAIGYPVPFVARLAVAIALMALVRRPWARALAAAIAVPALYSYSIVLLYALMPATAFRPSFSWRGTAAPVAERTPVPVAPA